MTSSIPKVGASADQFARWLFLMNQEFTKTVEERLGEESVSSYAEIEEGDEKVFLKECEECELPKITHEIGSCRLITQGAEADSMDLV